MRRAIEDHQLFHETIAFQVNWTCYGFFSLAKIGKAYFKIFVVHSLISFFN